MPRGRLQHSHRKTKGKQQNKVEREIKTLEPGSLDSILPKPHPVYNRRSQHHPRHQRIFDKPISNKTQRKTQTTVGAKQKDPTNPCTQRIQPCIS
jgi:hypothetical protein